MLCDLDGTLIVDHPRYGNLDLVRTMPGVVESIAKLRASGLAIGLVTNESAVSHGLITLGDVLALNERVAELIGPFHTIAVCTHDLTESCRCRKPAPGMIRATARALHIPTRQCVVIGCSGVDIGAARLAGAAAIMLSGTELEPFPAWWNDDDSGDDDGDTVGSFAEATERILQYS